MDYVSVSPASGSLINRGDVITITFDSSGNTALPQITYRPPLGPDEVILAPQEPLATFGAGYTGSIQTVSGVTTVTFKRDNGWADAQFNILIFDVWNYVETQLNFRITGETQYPPLMTPTVPPSSTGSGTIEVLDDVGDVNAPDPVTDGYVLARSGNEWIPQSPAQPGPHKAPPTMILIPCREQEGQPGQQDGGIPGMNRGGQQQVSAGRQGCQPQQRAPAGPPRQPRGQQQNQP